ncbi:hypothetical protein R1flu_004331 [Riccia fluitans]|uniref:CCHC-type domain-containing protein n=1 Tax=Riccia fluitans TaxID=41844 RepID=A0ABD1YPZ9_9MARC
MVQLYQGAQEIQKRFDWKGTLAVRYNREAKEFGDSCRSCGKSGHDEDHYTEFCHICNSDSHGARDCRLKGRRAPTVKAVELGTPQIVSAVPFCFFCHKSGHTFHQGCPEYTQKFGGYRNQREQGGQHGNGVRRPAPGCKALTRCWRTRKNISQPDSWKMPEWVSEIRRR